MQKKILQYLQQIPMERVIEKLPPEIPAAVFI